MNGGMAETEQISDPCGALGKGPAISKNLGVFAICQSNKILEEQNARGSFLTLLWDFILGGFGPDPSWQVKDSINKERGGGT